MHQQMLLFLLGLINLVAAQEPRPCFSPPQWESRIYTRYDAEKSSVAARLSYDSVYQRIRVLQDLTFSGVTNHLDIVRLFQAKLEFILDLKTNNCTRGPLERAWRDIGQLPDAQSLGEAYIGSSGVSGAGIRVTLWSVSSYSPN